MTLLESELKGLLSFPKYMPMLPQTSSLNLSPRKLSPTGRAKASPSPSGERVWKGERLMKLLIRLLANYGNINKLEFFSASKRYLPWHILLAFDWKGE
jgi:hypothetical protein